MVETRRESAGCWLNFPVSILSFGTHKVEVVYDFGIYDKAKNAIVSPYYNPIAAALNRSEVSDIDDISKPKKHNVRIEIVPVEVIKKHS